MMKTNNCELVFILDRSGSMGGLESDTIGGFNSMLKKQKQEDGQATVTTVLFDDKYELLHDRINLEHVNPITEKEYYVRGMTALLDAMGKTINKIKNVQKSISDDVKANKVLFVIITDGMENSSKEYSNAKIKKMVSQVQKTDNWEFIFLGANIDAIATAKDYGISAHKAVDYHADSQGTGVCYEAVCAAVSTMRANKPLYAKWKQDAAKDYKKRSSQ